MTANCCPESSERLEDKSPEGSFKKGDKTARSESHSPQRGIA